jgi:hypothetical protein
MLRHAHYLCQRTQAAVQMVEVSRIISGTRGRLLVHPIRRAPRSTVITDEKKRLFARGKRRQRALRRSHFRGALHPFSALVVLRSVAQPPECTAIEVHRPGKHQHVVRDGHSREGQVVIALPNRGGHSPTSSETPPSRCANSTPPAQSPPVLAHASRHSP